MPTNFNLDENLGAQLDAALAAARNEPDAKRREALVHVLETAKQQWTLAAGRPYLFAYDPERTGEEFALSLVLSALAGRHAAPEPRPAGDLFAARKQAALTPVDPLVGTPSYTEYSDLDPRWVRALGNYLTSDPLPFPVRKDGQGIITIESKCRIGMAGDWGTGNASSLRIGELIAEKKPDYTIHLGDVYYSGLPDEERDKFVKPWPPGARATFALNSNHEMYSGGAGYLGVTLLDPKFKAQSGLSYFLLQNDDWAIFGLDSAYYSSSFLYEKGQLDPVQLAFLREHGKPALEDGRQVMILTHHNGLKADGATVDPLWSQVTDALGTQGLCHWYWGHEHAAYSFKPRKRDYPSGPLMIKARCVGHGGVPFGPIAAGAELDWSEDHAFVGDPHFPNRALNGFVMLSLDGPHLVEEFWDETGERRFAQP